MSDSAVPDAGPEGAAPPLREVELVPVALPEPIASRVAAAVSRRLRVPCRVAAAASADALPELESRNQVDADRLLRRMEAQPPPPGVVRTVLTGRDLAIPIFTFVFGRARRFGGVAVVSTARLDPRFQGLPANPERLVARATAEVLHELGHVLGLDHCRDAACLMSFANNVERVDLRGASLCPRCASASAANGTPWLLPPG